MNDYLTDYLCVLNEIPIIRMAFENTMTNIMQTDGYFYMSDYFNLSINKNELGQMLLKEESDFAKMYKKSSLNFKLDQSNFYEIYVVLSKNLGCGMCDQSIAKELTLTESKALVHWVYII